MDMYANSEVLHSTIIIKINLFSFQLSYMRDH
jgi:hypothetical protein